MPELDPRPKLDWDGRSATVSGAGGVVALHIDGSPFVRWTAPGPACLRQEFPFTPSGYASMQLQLFVDATAVHAPLAARFGSPGLSPVDDAPWSLAPLPTQCDQRLPLAAVAHAARVGTTVLVPVHNAAAALARCLAAVRRYTESHAHLLLIDDASSDPEVQDLLDDAAQWPHTRVLRNAANLGFTATVNRGLRLCGGNDVVLLNADTEVGPAWLGGLRRAACSANDIATATAVSDNAGAFSVPELEHANALPTGWTHVDAARALLQGAGLSLPQLPTGNGFCMYLRADALAEIGELDAETFAQGYGEENDWCQRAEQHGWRHVIAGHVFVAHARSQSFGDARRRQLGQQGMTVLRQRYPGYEAAVGEQLYSYRRQVLDWRVRCMWSAGVAPRLRHLHLGERPAVASTGDVWQVCIDSNASLLDHSGCIREHCAPTALQAELLAWLQRYGFEVASGELDGVDIETLCAALGIKYLRT